MSEIPSSPTRAELAREVLLNRMRLYSEDYHCAGWVGGLEFLLWDLPPEKENSPSAKHRHELIPELRTLGEIAGGWWVYEDESQPNIQGPIFIDMQLWLEILSQG